MWSNETKLKAFKHLLPNLYRFAKHELAFKDDIKYVTFVMDKEDKLQQATLGIILGDTGGYDPEEKKITLTLTGRAPKDVLRSFAHELVHHAQAERGDFSSEDLYMLKPGYAQKSGKLRHMEAEAYQTGNLIFRDWEDSIKAKESSKKMFAESTSLESYFQNKLQDPKEITIEVIFKPIEELRQRHAGGEKLERSANTSLDAVVREVLDPLMDEIGFDYNMCIPNDAYSYTIGEGRKRTEITFFLFGAGGLAKPGNPYATSGDIRVQLQIDRPDPKHKGVGRKITNIKFDSLAEAVEKLLKTVLPALKGEGHYEPKDEKGKEG